MKILSHEECPQGEDRWFRERAGKITGSGMANLLTPKKLEPSKQVDAYLAKLLAERLLGAPVDTTGVGSPYMQRGTNMEDEARRWYEFDQDVDVQRVGLVIRDDGNVAVSPDGFVGDDGMVELKCPGAVKHAMYLMKPARLVDDYRIQIQSGLWVCQRKWCDAVSFNPGMPGVVQRVEPDPAFADAADAAVDAFMEALFDAYETHRPRGMQEQIDADRAELEAIGLLR